MNINVHFHSPVVQGIFVQNADGTRRFVPAPAPTDREVTRLLGSIRRRIVRLVARHGIPSTEVDPGDERLFDCPVYAEIQGAAVLGRFATGPRAGAGVVRVGRDAAVPVDTASAPLHVQIDGFDLHAPWRCRRGTEGGSNIRRAMFCARPWPGRPSNGRRMARCCSASAASGGTGPGRSGSNRASCSRSWPPSSRGPGNPAGD